MDNYDIKINTKHIVKNDVLFCFTKAEKYFTNDIFAMVSKMYVESGFLSRISVNKQVYDAVVSKNSEKILTEKNSKSNAISIIDIQKYQKEKIIN